MGSGKNVFVMQSYPIKSTPANLMEDLSMRLNRVTEGARKNLQKLAYQRDPDSLLDEALIGMWLLLIIAMAFTVAFGAYYHYQILQNAFGVGMISVAGSFLVFIVLEIAKVFFGLHFCRAFLSMLWWRSLYRFLFTCGIGFIVVMAFMWSIKISTKGVAEVNQNLKSAAIFESQEFSPPPTIADIDARIAELDQAKQAGARSTWKGRTTQKGIEVIQSNTELQKNLLSQRETLMAAAMAQHDSIQAIRLLEVRNSANMLTDYGGKAEYATMLLLFLIVILELINYEKNKHETPIVGLKK